MHFFVKGTLKNDIKRSRGIPDNLIHCSLIALLIFTRLSFGLLQMICSGIGGFIFH